MLKWGQKMENPRISRLVRRGCYLPCFATLKMWCISPFHIIPVFNIRMCFAILLKWIGEKTPICLCVFRNLDPGLTFFLLHARSKRRTLKTRGWPNPSPAKKGRGASTSTTQTCTQARSFLLAGRKQPRAPRSPDSGRISLLLGKGTNA